MIVPTYWAEARKQVRKGNRQVTVRRWGWSDDGQPQAEAMAEARAEAALQEALAGHKVLRREPRVAYNGADGVPIREEILARHGDVVITRNSYGARCLNTPDVVFADVDFTAPGSITLILSVFVMLLALAVVAGWQLGSVAAGIGLAFLGATLASTIARFLLNARSTASGGPEALTRKRVRRFLEQHPSWSVRMYRTPAGLRLLATHAPMSPESEEVQSFFRAISADPVYVRMCLNQNCFRARLSAKPWRIGIEGRMKPRPGVWPVRPERLPERRAWVEAYEKKAAGFAACAFVETLGSGVTHPKIAPVVALHDTACRATIGAALA